LQLPSLPQDVEAPAVQLVAQQTFTLVLLSSVTHWAEVHCPLDVQVAPFARSVDVSVVEESCGADESVDDESVDDESMAPESLLDESATIDESPPLPESTPVSGDVLSPTIMLSPSGPSETVPSSRPPSTGILLRSKSTMSSQPPTINVLLVRTAVSRPHLIERFVFMRVLACKP
jgi:hypothetical protein